jgi:protease secretion system membrane fusion protein
MNLTTEKSQGKATATEVISHDVSPLIVNTDAGAYSKLGWLVVLAGVGGFLLWAMFAPLDKGVPLQGTVAKESNRKTIQHQSGGTVQDILVRDGDVVKAGQVLVRMNSVTANSQVEVLMAQYITARASEARLLAERTGAAAVAFPPALNEYKTDPRVIGAMALQTSLFNSRRSALRSELSAMDENIAGLKLQIQGVDESRESKKAQLAILKEQLESMRDLAKEGYVARTRLLELERTNAQLSGAMSEDIGNIGRSRRQVMEMTLRHTQREQEYQREVGTQLSDVQREAESLVSRIQGQKFELTNTEVKAPVDGIVVNLNVFTKGGVVAPGMHMMEIVPTNDPLVVEGQLAVNLIDKVHPGLKVDFNFSAFNANKTPHIPGVLTQVSADRTVDERTGNAYYKVRAVVAPEGTKLIAQKHMAIQPGMPVDMFVKTGERTMMSYLLKPVFDRSHSALTEE